MPRLGGFRQLKRDPEKREPGFDPIEKSLALRRFIAGSTGHLMTAGERLDDPAFGDHAMATLPQQRVKLPAQDLEIGNLAIDFGQVLTRNLVHGRA